MYIAYFYSHCPFLKIGLSSATLINVIKYKKYIELYILFFLIV
jgi:hypothetical protein